MQKDHGGKRPRLAVACGFVSPGVREWPAAGIRASIHRHATPRRGVQSADDSAVPVSLVSHASAVRRDTSIVSHDVVQYSGQARRRDPGIETLQFLGSTTIWDSAGLVERAEGICQVILGLRV